MEHGVSSKLRGKKKHSHGTTTSSQALVSSTLAPFVSHGIWTRHVPPITGAPAKTRYDGSVNVIGEKIYYFGGIMSGSLTNKISIYDTTTNSWAPDPDVVQSSTSPTSSSTTSSKNKKRTTTKDNKKSALPAPRKFHGSAAVGDKIYIFGGEFASESENKCGNDLWEYDTEGHVWKNLTKNTKGTPPSARYQHFMGTLNQKFIYIIGGRHENDKIEPDQGIHVLDVETLEWKQHTAVGERPFVGVKVENPMTNCLVINEKDEEKILLFADGFFAEDPKWIWILETDEVTRENKKRKVKIQGVEDIKELKWRKRETFGEVPHRTTGFSVCLANRKPSERKVLFFGGNNKYGKADSNTLYILDLKTLYWKKVELPELPEEKGSRLSIFKKLTRSRSSGTIVSVSKGASHTRGVDGSTNINECTPANFLRPRQGHFSATVKDRLYLYGGYTYSTHNDPPFLAFNDVYTFELNHEMLTVIVPEEGYEPVSSSSSSSGSSKKKKRSSTLTHRTIAK